VYHSACFGLRPKERVPTITPVIASNVVYLSAGVGQQLDVFFDDLHGRFIDVVVEDVASKDNPIHAKGDREIDCIEKSLQLIRVPHVFLVG